MNSLPLKISRRNLLRMATFGTVALALPTALSQSVIAQKQATFYQFQLGNFQCISFSDGILNPRARDLANNVTSEQLAKVLQESSQSEKILASSNILYINTGRNQVLVDVGGGSIAGGNVGKLAANLNLAGIDSNQIDSIIISHAHREHIGGFTDKSGELLYPNAKYYIHSAEFDFWMSPEVSLPKLRGGTERGKTMIKEAKEDLGVIRNRITKFEQDKEIIPGIFTIHTPGHTPGHIAIRVFNNNASLIHIVDAIHNYAINLRHPKWQTTLDADPQEAILTRQKILSQILSENSLVFASHFPFPGLGKIRQRGEDGFNWEPVS